MRKFLKYSAPALAVLPFAASAEYTAPAAFTSAVADATTAVGLFVAALIGIRVAATLGLMGLDWVRKIRSTGK